MQPVVLFLLKLALIGALEVFTWLGHLQIQHGALPFSSEQSPDTGGDCVGDDHWPITAEPSIRVRIPASNTDRIGGFVTASKLPDTPSTYTSQGSRGRTMNAPEDRSGAEPSHERHVPRAEKTLVGTGSVRARFLAPGQHREIMLIPSST